MLLKEPLNNLRMIFLELKFSIFCLKSSAIACYYFTFCTKTEKFYHPENFIQVIQRFLNLMIAFNRLTHPPRFLQIFGGCNV